MNDLNALLTHFDGLDSLVERDAPRTKVRLRIVQVRVATQKLVATQFEAYQKLEAEHMRTKRDLQHKILELQKLVASL